MHARPLRRQAVRLPMFLTLACLPLAEASAASLAVYGFDTFDGGFTITPSALATGVLAGQWQDADGTLSGYAGNPGRALGARDFDDGNLFRWSVQAADGSMLAVTGLRFDQQASASGPKFWALDVDGTRVATGATSTAFGQVFVPLALAPRPRLEFTLEGFDAGSALGTWRIDNFSLEGELQGEMPGAPSPVPLPPALPLFAAGLTFAAAGGSRWRAPQRQRHSRQPSSSGK